VWSASTCRTFLLLLLFLLLFLFLLLLNVIHLIHKAIKETVFYSYNPTHVTLTKRNCVLKLRQ
jgi:hypothetical protein